MNKVNIEINIDKTEIDDAISRAEILSKKIQEVKILADELTSCVSNINLKIKV